MKPWKQYQEDTAAYFRSIGLEAETDVTVKGVRTNHDVDVLVTSHFHGFDIRWIVECKLWRNPVNQLHVLALREIVADIGADRGILLSESGFQSGAIEAANMTNIQVTSLESVKQSSEKSIFALRLRELFDRFTLCRDRYWQLPKSLRIKYGLRPDLYDTGFSGDIITTLAIDILSHAFRGQYPFRSDTLESAVFLGRDKCFNTPREVLDTLTPLLMEFESKLELCEAAQQDE
ncbi:restriction endonuclease [Rheinheimera sp.]|uniref:restriction endonuclease n=1 Tax=Rheinheimera sp. TaxID=1869214 RepID=UPI002357AB36|nr:restriction endonuclease [Rheinheimera sp.]